MKKIKKSLFLNVVKAKYISDYKLWLEFNDGITGQVDLKDLYKHGGVFSPFHDMEKFKKFKVENFTVCWSDDVDVAPEYLQDLMFQQAGVVVSE